MNRKLFLILASAALVLSMLACSFGNTTQNPTEAPVINPPVNNPPVNNNPPANALEIISTSSMTDSYGAFYVFGEVLNNSSTPITSITLSITITDASGASLIKDFDGNVLESTTFYTMLYTIGEGESTPFSYYLGTTDSAPANYEVSIVDYSTGEANRANIDYQNIEIVEDGYGNYYLTGELVNLGDQWAHINGLVGGVLDDNNTVLSADWTGTFVTELAPAGDANERDRTPFAVDFPFPTQEATQWSIWWDADVYDVTDYSLGVEVVNSYFDDYGYVHLVGVVENYTATSLSSLVVAGLYDVDGVVLDAGYSYLSVPIPPGGSVPFDISYFGNVNYNSEQAARVDTYTVQFDPWNTYEPYYDMVELTYTGESVQKDGSTWYVTGMANNSSPSNLNGITVMVSVLDASNNLVAFGSTYLYPDSDSFAPGASSDYEVYIYLNPDLDTTGFQTVTTVIGSVAE